MIMGFILLRRRKKSTKVEQFEKPHRTQSKRAYTDDKSELPDHERRLYELSAGRLGQELSAEERAQEMSTERQAEELAAEQLAQELAAEQRAQEMSTEREPSQVATS